MSAALKRVEQAIAGWEPESEDALGITVADLRALVRMARESIELRRRVRLARAQAVDLKRYWPLTGGELALLLDLRKPLPKRATRGSR